MGSRRRRVTASLQALGAGGFPPVVELADGEYRFDRVLQHSFFAATGRYLGPSGAIVAKWARTTGFWGLPLAWLGRRLARRELRMYRHVADLDGVPALFGELGSHGFAHAYAEGRTHLRAEPLDAEFFDKLDRLVDRIHERDMAFVDLSKPDNILIGADGNPYLFDFQIAIVWPRARVDRRGLQRLVPDRLGRWVLHQFQRGDRAHLLKHRRRSAPGSLTEAEYEASFRRTWIIRVHYALTTPYRRIRRGVREFWSSRG